MNPFATVGFDLVDWQRDAVEAWTAGGKRPHTGTLEIFTGGGKSLVALECAAEAARIDPDLRVVVVVPTEALARQWIEVMYDYTTVAPEDVGLLGAGGSDRLIDKRVVIAVLNTAAKKLPDMALAAQPLMLIVDECHRAGAPTFSRVLNAPARYRLGLSATPDREELDDQGEPLAFDEQLVGRSLGRVVYRFSLRDARRVGWLPEYRLDHHGLALSTEERQSYERLSRRVDDAADALRGLGGDGMRARHLQGRQDDLGQAARSYVTLTAQRKDLLYRAGERSRVAARIVADAMRGGDRRVLLFHERVAEATELFEILKAGLPGVAVGIEHSRLSDANRVGVMADFRAGRVSVLVSVKSLIEGIDVPEADIGISVASSSSVRQRVQSLGRVLRRSFSDDAATKRAEMHLLYVADTVDESIYAKEDWADLTGEGANHYWSWPADPDLPPEPQDGPPASPRPTEEAEWIRLGEQPPAGPERWLGSLVGLEYSVDTLGTVTNHSGSVIANPQGVDQMVAAVRGRPGGRFRVTPTHRLVLVTDGAGGEFAVYVAGALKEPFEALEDDPDVEIGEVDVSALSPGDPYPGPTSKSDPAFKLRQKMGGVIERRAPGGGSEFALTEGTDYPELEDNARVVLEAWREALKQGVSFGINQSGHAWYTEGGSRRFLAAVAGGFVWPSTQEGASE